MEKLFPKFVQVNLELIETSVVPQIGNPAVEAIVKEVLKNLVITSELVTDENPNNKEQLNQLWSKFSTTPQVGDALTQLFTDAISKVEDNSVKNALLLVSPEIVKTVQVVTDNVKPDGKQIEEIWKGFVKSPKFLELIFSNIGVILEKLNLPNWLKNIINQVIKK